MGRSLQLSGAILLLVVAFAYGAPCDPATCKLPNCRCSDGEIPGGFNSNEIPQLVFLSFDEAVNGDNFPFYQEILKNRKNPNNHSITATFFVTHDHTNYSMLHQLYVDGHEIALHSISGNASQDHWQSLDKDGWSRELMDHRTIMNNFGRIPPTEIKGARAPQLQIGGDAMYQALTPTALPLTYDCSRPTQAYRNTLWPYTNDFDSTQDCQIETCPTGVYKGFWTVPMPNWDSGTDTCSMADQCTIDGHLPRTEKETYDLIVENFNGHYTGNRSPYGVFIRHGWVNGTDNPGDNQILQRRLGYVKFLDYLGTLNDVYIVSIFRGVQWIQTPKNLADSATFDKFQVVPKTNQCPRTYDCFYDNPPPPITGERYFRSCTACPVNYPWVGNPTGAALP